MNDFFESRRHTIPAGSSTLRLPISGTLFRLLDSSQPLSCKFVRDGGTEGFDLSPGQGRHYRDGKGFQLVEISRHADYPATTDDLVFLIGHGTGEFLDNRAVPAINRLTGWADMKKINLGTVLAGDRPATIIGVPLAGDIIAGAASVTLDGTPPTGCLARKALIISNDDPSNKLTVKDAIGTVCLRVYPFTSVRLDVSESVTVHNANGSAVSCCVSEIWYTA